MATLSGGQVDGTAEDDVIFLDAYDPEGVFANGRGGNDTIAATSSSDATILGGEGDDWISVGRGDYSIDGGDGDDVIQVQGRSTIDATTIHGGDGFDTLAITSPFHFDEATIDGFERVDLVNTAWAREDQIVGQGGENLFEISMTYAGQYDQLIIYIDGDRLNLSQLRVDGLAADSIGRISAYGSSAASDTMTGSAYGDILAGYGGDDLLRGGGGRDIVDGGDGSDTLLGADDDDILYGFYDADRLYGGDGDDSLYGGSGSDVMTGGMGDDFYSVVDATDFVHDGAGRGTDTVSSSITYALGSDIENLTLRGAAAIDGTGNGFANVIVGNTGANVIDGGRGADTLTGGDGRDLFVFSSHLRTDNVDLITDYVVGEDRIRIDSAVFETLSAGGLAPRKFVIGTQALDANDFVIYHPATGSLWFDRDGSGRAAAVEFAVLDGAPALSREDFVIV